MPRDETIEPSSSSSSFTWKKCVSVLVIGVVLREVLLSASTTSVLQLNKNSTSQATFIDILADLRSDTEESNHTSVQGESTSAQKASSNRTTRAAPFERLTVPIDALGSERSFPSINATTQYLSQWVDEILKVSPGILDSRCRAWENKTDTAVRLAPRLILADRANIFETIPGVRTQTLSVPHNPIFMSYPHISHLDPQYGFPAHHGFKHTSHFRRFFGKLHRNNPTLASFPQWSGSDGPYFIAALQNAFLTFRDHILLCDDERIGLHLSSCLRNGHLLKRSRPSKIIIIPPRFPTVNVGIPLCSKGICRWGGPFHLIVEHLARIAPVAGLIKARPDVVLIVTGDEVVEPMIFTYLKWMGIEKGKVVNIPSGVRARIMLYTPAVCFHPLPFSMRVFRDVVFYHLNITVRPQAQPLLIFADRMVSKGSWRTPGNYPAVKAAIIELCNFVGYKHQTVYDIADPVTIRGFASADVVVGVHGANLSPTMFMKPGASLVEFLARKLHPLCFYHVASLLGVQHFPIFYDFPHFHEAPASVSPMHIITQVVASMSLPPEQWALFVLHSWALRQTVATASSGSAQLGIPVRAANGTAILCRLNELKEHGIAQLFIVGSPVNGTPSIYFQCRPANRSSDSAFDASVSGFLCRDKARGCSCNERTALDLLDQSQRQGVSVSVSPHFTELKLTLLVQLGSSPLDCGDHEPCRITLAPFFV